MIQSNVIHCYRRGALEAMARQALEQYDVSLLYGEPRAIPIEEIIVKLFHLTLEYYDLSEDGNVLGKMVFSAGNVTIYLREEHCYTQIPVSAGTMLIDNALRALGKEHRLRYTLAHECAHWIKDRYLFEDTDLAAACIADDEQGWLIDRQTDQLAAMLLMPKQQVKRCALSLRGVVHGQEELISRMARVFDVSREAMRICLTEHNLFRN